MEELLRDGHLTRRVPRRQHIPGSARACVARMTKSKAGRRWHPQALVNVQPIWSLAKDMYIKECGCRKNFNIVGAMFGICCDLWMALVGCTCEATHLWLGRPQNCACFIHERTVCRDNKLDRNYNALLPVWGPGPGHSEVRSTHVCTLITAQCSSTLTDRSTVMRFRSHHQLSSSAFRRFFQTAVLILYRWRQGIHAYTAKCSFVSTNRIKSCTFVEALCTAAARSV